MHHPIKPCPEGFDLPTWNKLETDAEYSIKHDPLNLRYTNPGYVMEKIIIEALRRDDDGQNED